MVEDAVSAEVTRRYLLHVPELTKLDLVHVDAIVWLSSALNG